MFCRSEKRRELKEQQRQSEAIDGIIAQDAARMRREVRMLLLGPCGSGKTTIRKQMKILYQGGYTDDERADFRLIIFRNIVEAAQLLVDATNKLGIPFEDFKNVELCDYIVDYTVDSDTEKKLLETPFVEAVASLWSDPSASKVLERSNKLYFRANSLDSASYFFDEIHRISSPGYLPTDNDILRARSKTLGISETKFSLEPLDFQLIDLGSTSTERRKWIHHFDNMTSILFVVALSDYDRIFHPDCDEHVLTETLELFDSIVNSRWFQRSNIILFFNKIDLFRKKLPFSPLAKYFPDYRGGSDVTEAVKYLLSRFCEINHGDRQIYAHITQATDTSSIRFVFHAVKDSIISCSLGGCTLL